MKILNNLKRYTAIRCKGTAEGIRELNDGSLKNTAIIGGCLLVNTIIAPIDIVFGTIALCWDYDFTMDYLEKKLAK